MGTMHTQNEPDTDRIEIEKTDEALIVRIDGDLFCEYRYAFDPRPIIYPLHAPGGAMVTRHYPMDEAENESRDHPHHQSLWFAHGDVNGHDFWHPGTNQRRIVHDEFIEITPGIAEATVISTNLWMTEDGLELCAEKRTMIFAGDDTHRTIDFTFTLTSSVPELRFGDTKEGTMAMRLAPQLRLNGTVARGKALNSEGIQGKNVWGKRARWVAYSGPIDGQTVTVVMFDHPSNLSHPTWWHARDYGLFAANPFGVHDFENKPARTGDHTISEGETLTLRYRIAIFSNDPNAAQLEEEFARFAAKVR